MRSPPTICSSATTVNQTGCKLPMCLFQSAEQSPHLHICIQMWAAAAPLLFQNFTLHPRRRPVCVRSPRGLDEVSQSCYSLKRTVGPALPESDREEGPTSSRVSRDTQMINGLLNVPGSCANFLAHFSPPEPDIKFKLKTDSRLSA